MSNSSSQHVIHDDIAGFSIAVHLRPTRLSGKKEKFLEAFSDRGGLVAEIIEGGTIKKGDLISLKAVPSEAYYYRNRADT